MSIEQLTRLHLWTPSLHDGCTPWHFGLSFFTSHAAMSLQVEQALQAIDPLIALPYWDWVLDDQEYGREWKTRSPLFKNASAAASSDDADGWFGSLTPWLDDIARSSGRRTRSSAGAGRTRRCRASRTGARAASSTALA